LQREKQKKQLEEHKEKRQGSKMATKPRVMKEIQETIRETHQILREENLLPKGFRILDLDLVSEADNSLKAKREFKKKWAKYPGTHTVDIGNLFLVGKQIDIIRGGKQGPFSSPTLMMAYQGTVSRAWLLKAAGWITGDI